MRFLPTTLALAAALILVLGGLPKIVSNKQIVEVSFSQTGCGDLHCCDDDSLADTDFTFDNINTTAELSMLCCDNSVDCDCSCCHPLVGTSCSIANLRRLRDTKQSIERPIVHVACLHILIRHSLLSCNLVFANVFDCESLLKQKSLLMV